jgi:hypothetical protein
MAENITWCGRIFYHMSKDIKTKLNEKWKWIKRCNVWKIKIDEQKRWTKHVHNQELCLNPNNIFSQPKGIY